MNKFWVLLENGQPIGVSRETNESQVKEWQKAAPNRKSVLVEEMD